MVHADAPERAVALRIKLAYGAGSIADGAKNAVFNSFLMLYYSAVLGLPAGWAGAAILIAMIVDAVTDPLMGSISDNFRSRWGRRHPFMYFAALPMGACFYFLMAPPAGLGNLGLFAWMTAFSVGIRLFLTFYMVPSSALGPEITTHYDERTSLVSYRWMLGWLGAISVSQMGWRVFLADDGAGITGRLDPASYPALGLYCAVLSALAILVSSAGTHSLIPSLRQAAHSGPLFSLPRFVSEVRRALGNRSYRMVLFAALFSASAIGVQEVFGTYINTYFWEFRSEQLALMSGLAVVPVLGGVLAARPLSARFDKRRTAIALATFAVLFGPLAIVLRLRGRCVMTTWDPDTQQQSPEVFQLITECFDGKLALDCWVIHPGTLRVGDPVEVTTLGAHRPRESDWGRYASEKTRATLPAVAEQSRR